jgi:hypothetical protein
VPRFVAICFDRIGRMKRCSRALWSKVVATGASSNRRRKESSGTNEMAPRCRHADGLKGSSGSVPLNPTI